MSTKSYQPLIFISYSHLDEPEHPRGEEVRWLSFVCSYLKPALKGGILKPWDDRHMVGGADWEAEIEQNLRTCDIFILLVSTHSMGSDYVDKEISVIRERQRRGEEVWFYPLLLTYTPAAGLEKVKDKNLRPRNMQPFSAHSYNDQRKHMAEAADEIAEIAEEMVKRKGASEKIAARAPPVAAATAVAQAPSLPPHAARIVALTEQFPGARFRDFDAAPEMVFVPAGEFLMGSPPDEGNVAERPQHKVTIGNSFAVGVGPVTRGEFAAFIDAAGYDVGKGAHVFTGKDWKFDDSKSWRDPGFPQQEDHPVACVNWDDAEAYVAWLRERTGGKLYRLLTEAEWEFCCRAGTTTLYSTGNTVSAKHANFGAKGARAGTTSVSKFPPNPWGLYDMHGNVLEWCQDNWHDNYDGDPPSDGSVWEGGDPSSRVLRGGSWDSDPVYLRSASRSWIHPDYRVSNFGFRVARTL